LASDPPTGPQCNRHLRLNTSKNPFLPPQKNLLLPSTCDNCTHSVS
jgi:hypothetical protein